MAEDKKIEKTQEKEKKPTTSKARTNKSTSKKTTTTKSSNKAVNNQETTKKATPSKTKTTKTSTSKSTTAKGTTKKTTSTNSTKKTTTKKKSTGSTTRITKKDNKKIEGSEDIKKSKKRDSRVKNIISEQLSNIEKIEEVDKIQAKAEQEKEKEEKKVKIDTEKIETEIENAKKLPENKKKSIIKNVFINAMVAIAFVSYFIFINIGAINIESTVFIKDLKAFSIITLAITIILFEKSYSKDDEKIALFGIETLMLSIVTLISIYVFILYSNNFKLIMAIISIIVVLYYIIKSIIIGIKTKRDWKNHISDVKELIEENKEE